MTEQRILDIRSRLPFRPVCEEVSIEIEATEIEATEIEAIEIEEIGCECEWQLDEETRDKGKNDQGGGYVVIVRVGSVRPTMVRSFCKPQASESHEQIDLLTR